MSDDSRQRAARYYDRFCDPPPGDLDFYRRRVTTSTRVLDLGCGTGRVLVRLAGAAAYIHGLDASPAMLSICREKFEESRIDPERAAVEAADITNFDLRDRMPLFDLIIAPFRVMQNLETDEQVSGLMRCIAKHLSPGGEAILNTFCPMVGAEELPARWESRDGTEPSSRRTIGDETVTLAEDCRRYRTDPLIVYPDLIYRRFDTDGNPLGEAVLSIAMRVWYPDQLIALVESHGFVLTGQFGGYQGEPWGEGGELVVKFNKGN